MSIEKLDWVQAALQDRREVCANLDQDPNFAEHCGTMLPVIIASVSDMFGLRAGRTMHPKELLLAQGVPMYHEFAVAAGYSGVPLSFDGTSFAQQRKMAGNSFHQACSNGMMTFSLASARFTRQKANENPVKKVPQDVD